MTATVVERLSELCRARKPDQWEAYASRNRVLTVRWATSRILEAKESLISGHSVRIVKKKSVGFSAADGASDPAATVEAASDAAARKPPDPRFRSLPSGGKARPLSRDPRLAHLSLEEAVRLAEATLEAALGGGADLDVAGSLNAVSEEVWIRNSEGVDAHEAGAFLVESLTVEKGDALSALGTAGARRLSDFDPVQPARDALETVGRSRRVSRAPPGRATVLFTPDAMAEILEQELSAGVNGQAYEYGISFFIGKLGKRVAEPGFTLTDDNRHPGGVASKAVDDEGVPAKPLRLIDRGRLTGLVLDSYYRECLRRKGLKSLAGGRGFRFGTVPGRSHAATPSPSATNMVVSPGDWSAEELVEETRRGLLVGRLWYTYLVNPAAGDFATTNRGATFLIKDGEIGPAVKPSTFRIQDNILRWLGALRGLSRERKQSSIWAGVSSCISPWARVEGVPVTRYK
ncbi:MAG: TldD/PmbA family protein [Halobacteria archaeon]